MVRVTAYIYVCMNTSVCGCHMTWRGCHVQPVDAADSRRVWDFRCDIREDVEMWHQALQAAGRL